MVRPEVIRKRLNKLDEYLSILYNLRKYGYIDSDMEKELLQMIGFRNTLVHDYLEIDRRIVYDILQNHLKDIEEFKLVFAQFL